MTQIEAGSLMLALMALALGLAWWGWRRKKAKFSHLTGYLSWEVPSGTPVFASPSLYVATTISGEPLERVAIWPLAYRSKAQLSLFPSGLSVSLPGQPSFLIPRGSNMQAGVATWTIDRVVEPEGLLLVQWTLGPERVDSYFRLVDGDSSRLISMINEGEKG